MSEFGAILVSFFEFFVLGALTLLILASLAQGLRLGAFWQRVSGLLLGEDFLDDKFRRGTAVSILLGAMYLVGVLLNSGTQWILEPAHLQIIDAVAREGQSCASRSAFAEPDGRFYLRPFPGCRAISAHEARSFAANDRLESSWEDSNLEAYKHALDDSIKTIRIVRGAVVLSLWLGILHLLAIFVRMPALSGSFLELTQWLFPDRKPAGERNRLAEHVRYLAMAVMLYLFFMRSYWALESGYHRIVMSQPHGNHPGCSSSIDEDRRWSAVRTPSATRR